MALCVAEFPEKVTPEKLEISDAPDSPTAPAALAVFKENVTLQTPRWQARGQNERKRIRREIEQLRTALRARTAPSLNHNHPGCMCITVTHAHACWITGTHKRH